MSRIAVYWPPHVDCPDQYELLGLYDQPAEAVAELAAEAPAGTRFEIVARGPGVAYLSIAEAEAQ